MVDGVRAGLTDLGYVAGDTIAYTVYSAEGKNERLADLQRKLSRASPT